MIGGPGAFVVPIREREQVQGGDPHQAGAGDRRPHAGAPRHPGAGAETPRISCTIGEQMWRERWGECGRCDVDRSAVIARSARDDLDSARIAELIDRRDARRACSRRRPGCARRARRSPRLHDTATTTGTLLLASSRACASAPWRGGSNTTASKRLELGATSGRRNRSRVCASIGLRPCVVRGRALQRGDRAGIAVGGASRARVSASRSANGADAAEQVGDRFAPCRHGRATSCASAASPSAVACRNAPGGSGTLRAADLSASAARAAPPVRRGG